MTIREFHSTDARAVHALGASSPEAGQWSLGSYEHLKEDGMLGWVAEVDGVVRGFIVVRILPPEMEILNVVVARESRRQGIAAALFSAVEREARSRNVNRIFLEVRESNAAAISFYEHNSFRTVGVRAAYYAAPVESARLMAKKIAA